MYVHVNKEQMVIKLCIYVRNLLSFTFASLLLIIVGFKIWSKDVNMWINMPTFKLFFFLYIPIIYYIILPQYQYVQCSEKLLQLLQDGKRRPHLYSLIRFNATFVMQNKFHLWLSLKLLLVFPLQDCLYVCAP